MDDLALRPGDFVLIPHGEGHRLVSEPGQSATVLWDVPREQVSECYELLQHGEGGEPARMICGAVRFEHPAAQHLVALLPKAIHLEGGSEGTQARRRGCNHTPRRHSCRSGHPGVDRIRTSADGLARCAQGPRHRRSDQTHPSPSGSGLECDHAGPGGPHVALRLLAPIHGHGRRGPDGLRNAVANAAGCHVAWRIGGEGVRAPTAPRVQLRSGLQPCLQADHGNVSWVRITGSAERGVDASLTRAAGREFCGGCGGATRRAWLRIRDRDRTAGPRGGVDP
jgi:Cupin